MKKNLYGTRQAAANWFDMLKTGLGDQGFEQSKVEPYLFVRKNCIVIFYVDDFCIFSKDKEKMDALLINLSKAFKLTDEGGVKSYLGMNVRKYQNETITMRQPANVILTKYFSGAWSRNYADQVGSVFQEPDTFKNSQIVQLFEFKMQRERYLSTIKAEYISLSQSMRYLIQLRHIMLDVSSVFGTKCDSWNSYTTTFEENKGDMGVAN